VTCRDDAVTTLFGMFACCRYSCHIFLSVREAGMSFRIGWMYSVVERSSESRFASLHF